ncbi:MAG: hypothetical protein AAF740_09835, partial [Bacteroidota bacterium]
RYFAKIFYDPIYPLSEVQQNVEAAVLSYFENVPFDGTFRLLSIEDAIQQVAGVKDITRIGFDGRPTVSGTPANWQSAGREYVTQAGYAQIDYSNYPLLDQFDGSGNLIAAGTLQFQPD